MNNTISYISLVLEIIEREEKMDHICTRVNISSFEGEAPFPVMQNDVKEGKLSLMSKVLATMNAYMVSTCKMIIKIEKAKYKHDERVGHIAGILLTSWVRKTVVKEFSSIHLKSNSSLLLYLTIGKFTVQ